MPRFRKGEYEENGDLHELARRVSAAVPELKDSLTARWRVIYSLVELDHLAGKCRKLDGAIKFQTGLDFLILVHKEYFLKASTLEKLRVLCHEVYHVERDGRTLKNRRHGGDFCEIAEHDRYSYALARSAAQRLGISIAEEATAPPTQTV